MTNEEIQQRFCSVSKAALRAKRQVPVIYRWLQCGNVDGLCIDGHWLVEIASLERHLARQAREAVAQPALADAAR